MKTIFINVTWDGEVIQATTSRKVAEKWIAKGYRVVERKNEKE